MNCENRREKRCYYLSHNLVKLGEFGKGQKDTDGNVHSGPGHLPGARSTKEQCYPKDNAWEGMVLSEFPGRK